MTYCGTDHKGVLFTCLHAACFMFYLAKRTQNAPFIFPCNLFFSTAGELHVEHACCVFGQCCMWGEQRETNGGQCVAADTDIVAHLHKSMFWKYCLHTISFHFLFFSIAIDHTRRECLFLRYPVEMLSCFDPQELFLRWRIISCYLKLCLK